MEDLINDIPDTALWIAAYRAQETEREDAVFKDTLAKSLAGERDYQMVASTPHTKAMAFAMIVRTTAIDRLISQAVTDGGIDTVINLGAGLDTRPYRMNLPDNLKWIEVDFANIIKYKNDKLLSEKPVCSLRRISADLSLEPERRELFSRLGAEAEKALIITEGVISYLKNEQAGQLAKDIAGVSSFH